MKSLPFLITFSVVLAFAAFAQAVAPSEKLVYQPISAEAGKLGRIAKYQEIKKNEVEIKLGSLVLNAAIPVRCRAYDAVPIEYTLTGDSGSDQRVAVEAVAFENPKDRKGRDFYDLAILVPDFRSFALARRDRVEQAVRVLVPLGIRQLQKVKAAQ